jgi:antitoxin component YwqK of YwqJK toxin-antitoxin module
VNLICIFALNKTNIMEKQAQNLINLYNERGQRHGYWEEYYSNGQLRNKGNYVNDNRDGYWEEYYSNGKLWRKGNYVNGKQDGYWEAYYSNGKLMRKGNFVNGKFHEEKEQTELSMDEIAKKFGIPVGQLKIKK